MEHVVCHGMTKDPLHTIGAEANCLRHSLERDMFVLRNCVRHSKVHYCV